MSLTIGKFTLSDADALGGGGCTQLTLTNDSASVEADYQTFLNDGASTLDPGSNHTLGFGADELLNPVQAVLEDGTSFLTAMVGNDDGPTQANQNIPCINVGGAAGS